MWLAILAGPSPGELARARCVAKPWAAAAGDISPWRQHAARLCRATTGSADDLKASCRDALAVEANLRRGSATSPRSSRHHVRVQNAKWSPDTTRLALAGRLDPVRVVDARTLEVMGRASDHVPDSQLLWSPDGGTLFSVARGDLYQRAYNGFTAMEQIRLRCVYSPVRPSWSPDGALVAWGPEVDKVAISKGHTWRVERMFDH